MSDAKHRLFADLRGGSKGSQEGSGGEMRHTETVRGDEAEHGSVKIGARVSKHQLAFVPLPSNPSFGGRGLSLEYSHLVHVEFALDYSELTLLFTTHAVTLRGEHLKGLLDQIKGHICDTVEELDGLEAAGEKARFCVTGMELVEVKER